MNVSQDKVTTVDAYIASFPALIQEKLVELRKIIREVAPDAEEVISYAVPAYKHHGWLIYFAGYTKHVSISIPPPATEVFADELKPYKSSKAAVQFQLDQPLPATLIQKMILYRLKDNLKAEASRSKKV